MCKGINKKKVCVVSSQAIAGGVVVVVVIEVRERERDMCGMCVLNNKEREGSKRTGRTTDCIHIARRESGKGEGLYYKS